MRTYRDLFAVREFRALWTSSALSTAAMTMSGLALATVVHAETGSALLSALAMFGPSVVQVVGATTLMSAAAPGPPPRAPPAVGARRESAPSRAHRRRRRLDRGPRPAGDPRPEHVGAAGARAGRRLRHQ